MPSIRRVIEYSKMNYQEVLELPADVFLLMVKNHYIDELNKTPEGQQYLQDCLRLQETEPDEQAILKEIQRMKG